MTANTPPVFEQLGLIGCGLMGGSFALALKRAGLVRRVVGYSQSPATTERARQMGVIDIAAASAAQAASGADLILVAVPVSATEASFKAIRPAVAPQTLVMDVGSTKRDVIAAAQRVFQDQVGLFVPAHPIAGKERAGVEHADPDLYAGRQVILTPDQHTMGAQLQRARQVWSALGCHVKLMSAQAHDAAYAAVSHLPHLIAFALMNAVRDQTQGQEYLSLAGPGFRDFTRIAASDPAVWRDILMSNKDELLAQSRHFQDALRALETVIASDDADRLEALIDTASNTRSHWRMSAINPQG